MSSSDLATRGGAAAGGAAAVLPDINGETNPFELVQAAIDRAAYFNWLSLPAGGGDTLRDPAGRVVGFVVDEALHRFEITMLTRPVRQSQDEQDADRRGRRTRSEVRASNRAGERTARFRQRWLLIPDGFAALPGRQPPPTALDPTRSQRFVMVDAELAFGDGRDGFRGFGSGTTFPMAVGPASELWAASVGTLLAGFGRFAGLAGTYCHCGTLDPQRGFSGNLLLRVVDPEGRLGTDNSLPSLGNGPELEPGVTYLLLRGQKRDRHQLTHYRFDAQGLPEGFDVEQQLRHFDIDAATSPHGPRASRQLGPVVGAMTSSVSLNLLAPGAPGTPLSPIPFGAFNSYSLFDAEGEEVGGFDADGSEGRTFTLALAGLPGQQALRFGGFGTLSGGRGQFAGLSGLLTDNSVAAIAPHALSTLYLVRAVDPDHRLRA